MWDAPPSGPLRRRGRPTALAAWAAAGIVVLGLLAVFALELADTQSRSRQDVVERVQERATLAAALLDSVFSTTAATPDPDGSLSARRVPDRSLDAAGRTSAYAVLLDATGRVLARSARVTPAVRAQVGRSEAVARVRLGAPYALSDIERLGRGQVIDLATRIDTPHGRRILVTGFPPSALEGFITGELRRIPGVRGSRATLIDGNLRSIASTSRARAGGYVFRSRLQLQALSKPQGDYLDRFFVLVPVAQSNWRVAISSPREALFAPVSGLRKWVPWAIFALFALAVVAACLLARRALAAGDRARDAGDRLAVANAQLEATNAELEVRAAELARSNEDLEQFASIASHDLQEPLRKIRTFSAQVLDREGAALSERGRDKLERTNAAAERLQRLIEDLLRFSRVGSSGRAPVPVDLEALAREVVDALSEEIEVRQARVRIGGLPVVLGDASQLRQLLQNLISNGLKFQRPGVPPEIEVSAEARGEAAVVRVRDHGIGFADEYAQRIFRVFERLHGRSEYPGTGIGLALCRKIAERHGGSIEAEGRPGEGSTFVVTLPLAAGAAGRGDDQGGRPAAPTHPEVPAHA